jgi:hypothetical protein
MSEHHFLINYDTNTSEWGWSVETEIAHFQDGTIWLDDEKKWVKNNYRKDIQTLDDNLADDIGSAINRLNKKEGNPQWV